MTQVQKIVKAYNGLKEARKAGLLTADSPEAWAYIDLVMEDVFLVRKVVTILKRAESRVVNPMFI